LQFNNHLSFKSLLFGERLNDMDETSNEVRLSPVSSESRTPAAWRDLREWIDLAERYDSLHRIAATVDPHEELSAITYMRTQDEKAPAILFENLPDNPLGARVLTNMLGNSKERYALALGFDPAKPISGLIEDTRRVMRTKLAPVFVPERSAPVNENVLLGDDIDLTLLPTPKFWPEDGGRYIGTGDVTFTADPRSGRINAGVYRQMLHSRNRVGLYCSPGKHGKLDREAWWAKGQPCEVVAA
jgi:UbiD family decarboxylase